MIVRASFPLILVRRQWLILLFSGCWVIVRHPYTVSQIFFSPKKPIKLDVCMCVWVVWRETMNLLADLLRDYSNRRPDLIKPVKTSDETRSTLIDFSMKWREIVQWWSSSLAKLYRMELYDWYKKENKSTNTHKIERLLSRGGTEKFILFYY